MLDRTPDRADREIWHLQVGTEEVLHASVIETGLTRVSVLTFQNGVFPYQIMSPSLQPSRAYGYGRAVYDLQNCR